MGDRKRKITSDVSDYAFDKCKEMYIEERSKVLSPASIRKYKTTRNELAELGEYKIKDLNQDIVQRYINDIATLLSPKTVRDRYGFIVSVIKRYSPRTIINATLPKQQKVQRYVPSEDDIKKLFAAVKGTDMELPVQLGSICMMRRGETCALSKDDFHGATTENARNYTEYNHIKI